MAAAKSESKGGDLLVTAPLVEVATKDGSKRRYFAGDVVGDDVTKESVDHLRALGFAADDKG